MSGFPSDKSTDVLRDPECVRRLATALLDAYAQAGISHVAAPGIVRSALEPDRILAGQRIAQQLLRAIVCLCEQDRLALVSRYCFRVPLATIAGATRVDIYTAVKHLEDVIRRVQSNLELAYGSSQAVEAELRLISGVDGRSTRSKLRVVSAYLAAIAILAMLLVRTAQRWMTEEAPGYVATSRSNPQNPRAHSAGRLDVGPDIEVSREEAATQRVGIAAAPASDELPARIDGRILLPDGSPASNVVLRLRGSDASPARALHHGRPSNWSDLEVTTKGDGLIGLTSVVPRAYQYLLEATLGGYATICWRWNEIEPGAVIHLGDVTLQEAGRIRGSVRDEVGNAVLSDGWRVYAESVATVSGEGTFPTRVSTTADGTSAGFVLDSVPPGKIRLEAESDLTGWVSGPIIDVLPAGETHANIIYTGVDLGRRITVLLYARSHDPFRGHDTDVILLGPGNESRLGSRMAQSAHGYCFDGVPAGTYSVEICDPRYEPLRRYGIVPGCSVHLNLIGSAVMSLRVLEARTGSRIPRYSVCVRYNNVGSAELFELLNKTEDPPPDGVFYGMLPVSQTLHVQAPGYGETALTVGTLPANEITDFVAVLSIGGTVAGVVTRSDGRTQAPSTILQLVPRSSREHDRDSFSSVEVADRGIGAGSFRTTSTDSEGGFRFLDVPSGHYAVVTNELPPLQASIEDVSVGPDPTTSSDLRLVLTARGSLEGRLVCAPGTSFADLRILVHRSSDDLRARIAGAESQPGGYRVIERVASDGTFRVAPLPCGTFEVVLVFPDVESLDSVGDGVSVYDPPLVPIGVARIVDGEVSRVQFDLSQTGPGRVCVAASENGRPPVGAVVEIVGESACLADAGLPGDVVPVSSGIIDDRGTAVLGTVPAGVFGVVLRGLDHGWAYWQDAAIQVKSGELTSISVAISLHEGALMIVDKETDQPLCNAPIVVSRSAGGVEYDALICTSDPSGFVHLRLAHGDHRIRLAPADSDAASTIGWTASGPSCSTVEVDAEAWTAVSSE